MRRWTQGSPPNHAISEPLMLDERSRRRATFTEGPKIRLADGQEWVLAQTTRKVVSLDDFRLLLNGLREAEDHSERLRAELALCIDLLTRNHDLPPEELQRLLSFPRNSPDLARFQAEMHAIAVEVCCASVALRW